MRGPASARRVARLVAALGLAVSGLVVPAVSAGAATVMPAGSVTVLYRPGVALTPPHDGRLRAWETALTITGVAFTDLAGTNDTQLGSAGDSRVSAAPGDQLAVIAVTISGPTAAAANDLFLNGGNVPFPTYTLQAGGQTINLDPEQHYVSAGQVIWAVGIPAGAAATFTLAQNGFAQSFDLRAGKRIGTSPTALYRSWDSPDITEQPNVTEALSGTGSPADPVHFAITLSRTTVWYFQPGNGNTPVPPADRAWLVVGFGNSSGQDAQGHPVALNDIVLGPQNLSLTWPGGTHETAAGYQNVDQTTGLLVSLYWFPVPGTFTTGTMTLNPGGPYPALDNPIPADLNPADGNPFTLTFTAPVSFPIDIPVTVGQPPTVSHTAAPTVTLPPTSIPGAAPSGGHGGLPVAVIVIIAAAVFLAVGGLVWWWRRRSILVRVRPVTRPLRALLAPTAAELAAARVPAGLPAPPRALAPGPPLAPPPFAPPYVPPAGPDADGAVTAGPHLVLRLLGPPGVEGLVRPVRRRPCDRLLWTLGVAAREVTVEELRDLLAADADDTLAPPAIHENASRLRSSLPAGVLPPIAPGRRGYQLLGDIDVDTLCFMQLANRAQVAEGPDQVELGVRALSLIRGPVLAYATWFGIERLVRWWETQISTLAIQTVTAALQQRDARAADQALASALLALPGDPPLWEHRIIAAAAGSGISLDRVWELSGDEHALGQGRSIIEPTYQRLRRGEF